MHSLWFVQWDFTRRDHPGNLGRVSESSPVISTPSFNTSSLYSVEATVLRVLLQLESSNSKHRNLRYVLNNQDYSIFKT